MDVSHSTNQRKSARLCISILKQHTSSVGLVDCVALSCPLPYSIWLIAQDFQSKVLRESPTYQRTWSRHSIQSIYVNYLYSKLKQTSTARSRLHRHGPTSRESNLTIVLTAKRNNCCRKFSTCRELTWQDASCQYMLRGVSWHLPT